MSSTGVAPRFQSWIGQASNLDALTGRQIPAACSWQV